MSRQFDAKKEALAAYPDDKEAGVSMFLGYLGVSKSDFAYEEGMSAEEYIYGSSAHMNTAFHMQRAVSRLELAFLYLVEARMLDQAGDIDLCIGTIRATIRSLGGGEDRSCETCRYSVDDDCTAGDGQCFPPNMGLWQEKPEESITP